MPLCSHVETHSHLLSEQAHIVDKAEFFWHLCKHTDTITTPIFNIVAQTGRALVKTAPSIHFLLFLYFFKNLSLTKSHTNT